MQAEWSSPVLAPSFPAGHGARQHVISEPLHLALALCCRVLLAPPTFVELVVICAYRVRLLVSTASASTVHVGRAPFQRHLSCTDGLVTVPPVTSPFDLAVPPPSPAKAEQLRGSKCRSRGTYRNSGRAEETPPTESQTGRRETLTGGTDGGRRRAHQKHRREGRDDQQRQRRRPRGAKKLRTRAELTPPTATDRCGRVADGGHRKQERPSREAWTSTTCAGWCLLECFPRHKVFQRSKRMFYSL